MEKDDRHTKAEEEKSSAIDESNKKLRENACSQRWKKSFDKNKDISARNDKIENEHAKGDWILKS